MMRFLARVTAAVTLLVLLATAAGPGSFVSAASVAADTPATTGVNTPEPANNPNGAFNVVVSPTSQVLDVKPGGTVSTTLQIKNQGIATEHIKVSVMKFGANGDNGTPELIKPGAGDDFVNWAHFSATTFDAQPNVWTPIQVTISPPKTAALGYYYAIVFSRTNASTGGHAANLLAAVASLVLLDVEVSGAHPSVSIAEFSASHKVYEFLPADFTVKMHNTGNIFLAPRGNIFISKGGKNIAILEVNLGQGNILPGTNRAFTASWADGTPVYKEKIGANKNVVLDSQGQPEMHLSWNNFSMSKLRFGKYHAQLVMVYNNGSNDVSEQANLTFWVIPWRIIVALLVVVLLLLAGLWATLGRPLRRRLSKRRGNKTATGAEQ